METKAPEVSTQTIVFLVMSLLLFWLLRNYHIDITKLKLLKLVCALLLFFIAVYFIKQKIESCTFGSDSLIHGPAENAVFCGTTDKKKKVYLKTSQRSMHTQVVGTTNAGKTESVILPWAIQDIEQGRGLILIDGKADHTLLNKLWSYVVKNKREGDFKLFSLSNLDASHSFNPLIGGTPEEITERVFNSFEFENPHYRSLQFEVMGQVMRIFSVCKITPTFQRLHQFISYPTQVSDPNIPSTEPGLGNWWEHFKSMPAAERDKRTSGLLAALSHFSYGQVAPLFNTEKDFISLGDVLSKNQIVYFQLPVLLSPFLGKATGKLILQSLQAAIAQRHRSSGDKKFISTYLDDFTEYLYPGFVSILNKSRSANVGIVFAHQALGDIESLGAPIANAILTNSNVKVFMRGNDPDSAEYYSKVIGTVASKKFTEREKDAFFGKQKTGDVSSRIVEEFVAHPNLFKNELGVGEAMMLIPHDKGVKTVRIKFKKYDDLKTELKSIPEIEKKCAALFHLKKPDVKNANPAEPPIAVDVKKQTSTKETA